MLKFEVGSTNQEYMAFKDGMEAGILRWHCVGNHYHFCWSQNRFVWLAPGEVEQVRKMQKALRGMIGK